MLPKSLGETRNYSEIVQNEKFEGEIKYENLNDVNEREAIVQSIENFGADPINKSTDKNNYLLKTQLKNYSHGGTESENVGDKLMELNKQVRELDPSGVDWSNNGLMSKFFNPVKP